MRPKHEVAQDTISLKGIKYVIVRDIYATFAVRFYEERDFAKSYINEDSNLFYQIFELFLKKNKEWTLIRTPLYAI